MTLSSTPPSTPHLTLKSALYVGHVAHYRMVPKRHRLRNRVYWLLADLDELAVLDRKLKLFSHNRFNLASLCDRDHGDGSGGDVRGGDSRGGDSRGGDGEEGTLKAQMLRHLEAAGIDCDGMAVQLLCMPRVAGYDFNPLSVYFCRDREGSLAAIIYEVNNTFGGRHSYVIAARGLGDQTVRQQCAKAFYVSPFMDLDMTYRFRVRPPGDAVAVAVEAQKGGRAVINTVLTGRRREFTDANLARLALTHPLNPLTATAAIYWNAAKLWLRGFTVNPARPSRDYTVTIVKGNE